jgi:hypothetical protein
MTQEKDSKPEIVYLDWDDDHENIDLLSFNLYIHTCFALKQGGYLYVYKVNVYVYIYVYSFLGEEEEAKESAKVAKKK